MTRVPLIVLALCLPLAISCGDKDDTAPPEGDTDTDTDTDTDADTDTDSDTDCTSGEVSDHQGIAMAYICPDTFVMGSPGDEAGRATDETQYEVTLTGGFYLGVYEVTQAEFESFLGYQPSSFSGCANCPAESMGWHEAAAFTNEVSDTAGLARCYVCSGSGTSVSCEMASDYQTPYDCEGYRLLTEAEWEMAARAGTTSAFSNGGNLYSGDTDGNGVDDVDECSGGLQLDNITELDDIAWYCGNASSSSAEVGQLSPNPTGLYDMSGNVWEWCHDWYEEDAYSSGSVTDPWGDSNGTYRVMRGGSWFNPPHYQRLGNRHADSAQTVDGRVGLRIAKSE